LQNGAQISAKITKNFELSKKIGIFFHFWTIFGALFRFFILFLQKKSSLVCHFDKWHTFCSFELPRL